MLTFYDPKNEALTKESDALRQRVKFVMENIINRVRDTLEKQRSSWTLEDYKNYPKNKSAPNGLRKTEKDIKELAITLAGIHIMFGGPGRDARHEIEKKLAEAFFKTPFYKMGTVFLKNDVKQIVDEALKKLNVTKEDLPCKNEEKKCLNWLKWYYFTMHIPFELNAYPYENLGFGKYLAYFSRLISSQKEFLAGKTPLKGEIEVNEMLIDVMSKLRFDKNPTNLSVIELVRLLHNKDDKTWSIASYVQNMFDCDYNKMEAYNNAWEKFMRLQNQINTTPCENVSYYNRNNFHDYSTCCEMFKLIQGDDQAIMKVMKYSTQPAQFEEPLERFLESFDNLDFLPFSNMSKYRKTYKYKKLMDINPNPRVFMCNYASKEKLSPGVCNLFHIAPTNEGIGYTFNNANFWDIFSIGYYTNLFAKIFKPKGYHVEQSIREEGKLYPKSGIQFPLQSGLANGLEVSTY